MSEDTYLGLTWGTDRVLERRKATEQQHIPSSEVPRFLKGEYGRGKIRLPSVKITYLSMN